MHSDAARQIVETASHHTDGYQQAMRELEANFRSPSVVHPIYVDQLLSLPTYTYTKDSLYQLRTKVESIWDGLRQCGGDLENTSPEESS